ncbi:MAG: glycosyltransferase family 39 protein, partial [Elusimicrobiota bacterium]
RWLNFLHPPVPAALRVAPSVIGMHLLRIAACIWICLVLAGTGRMLSRRLSIRPHNGWEESALSFGLGYGAWGTGLLLLGLARLWYAPVLVALLVLATVPALIEAAAFRKRTVGGVRRISLMPASLLAAVAIALFWVGWLYHLPYSMIPETFYDALNYHLGLPNLYLIRHAIVPTPEHSYSGIPSVPGMLYGLALSLDRSGIVAQLLHNSMVLWAAAALMGFAGRLGVRRAGPVACAIFALTPVVTAESYRTSVGLEWALFQLLCFLCLAAASAAADSRERIGWTMACGSFLGLAMATKYPAWILPAALLAAMVYLSRARSGATRGPRPFSAREAGLLAAVGLLWLAPWIAKNLAFYGNPVYPFFHERFVPEAFFQPDWRHISEGGLDLRRTFSTAQGLRRFLLHPWVFSRHAWEFGGSIGPLYIGLLPLVFLARLPFSARFLGVLILVSWIPLGAVSSITRFFIPCLAPWSLLVAMALVRLSRGRGGRALTALACASLLLIGTAVWAMRVPGWRNLDVFLGGRPSWDYLSHTNHASDYPTPPHSGFAYLHANAPADAKVLIFGDSRRFPLRLDHLASSPDQASVLEVWANASRDGEELRERFARHGVTYIVVNHAEIRRNRTSFRFTGRGKRSLDEFWRRHALKVSEDGAGQDFRVVVYRVLDEEEAGKPHPVDDLFAAYEKRMER